MNLSIHEHYGRLIEYEHQKAERAGYRRTSPISTRKTEPIGGEVVIKPAEKDFDENI